MGVVCAGMGQGVSQSTIIREMNRAMHIMRHVVPASVHSYHASTPSRASPQRAARLLGCRRAAAQWGGRCLCRSSRWLHEVGRTMVASGALGSAEGAAEASEAAEAPEGEVWVGADLGEGLAGCVGA